MIIGIDDTGTVVEGEIFIISLIFIRPSQLDNLGVAFRRWEDLCRRKMPNRPQEIKSTDLSDDMYKDFIKNIILSGSHPVRHRGYMVRVDKNMLEWAEKQKQRYINQYKDAIEKAKNDGRTKWAKQANTLAGWIKNTPSGMLIKMKVLNNAVPDALNNSIGFSVVNDFDDELGEFRVMIDEGFIKDKATDFWKEILRSNIIQSSARKPMPHLDTWTDDHPFLDTFVDKTKDDLVLFKQELRNRINFHDSSDTIPVRIADITSGILRKKYIDEWDDDILKRFWANVSENGRGMTELKFTNNWDNPPVRNPYEEFNKKD